MSLADECAEEAATDWPLPGPRSAAWCLDFLRREGEGVERHHERFRQLTKTDAGNWGIGEHWQLCQFLKFAGEIDQLDLTNCVSVEAAFRRIQTIEYSYMDKVRESEAKTASGSRLTAEEQSVFGGTTRTHTALMISPKVLDYVRAEAERDASLAKNLRKAREEREALRKGK